MAEPTEAAWKRVREIMGYGPETDFRHWSGFPELAAHLQAVSDAVKAIAPMWDVESELRREWPTSAHHLELTLAPFILPDPVDPLHEAMREYFAQADVLASDADKLRAILAKRGLAIVEQPK